MFNDNTVTEKILSAFFNSYGTDNNIEPLSYTKAGLKILLKGYNIDWSIVDDFNTRFELYSVNILDCNYKLFYNYNQSIILINDRKSKASSVLIEDYAKIVLKNIL